MLSSATVCRKCTLTRSGACRLRFNDTCLHLQVSVSVSDALSQQPAALILHVTRTCGSVSLLKPPADCVGGVLV